MSVAVELPGYATDSYVASTNIMSVSGKDALKRQLTDLYPELAWPQLLNSAFSHLRREYFGADPSVDLSTIEPRSQEGRYRVGTLLPEGQPTIFFGDGSTGKTYLALVLALAVATGDELLGLPVIFDRVLVIDYETDA